jgi:hypothetical protein
MDFSFKTWLDTIESGPFNEWTKEQMIKEMPHTHFGGSLPGEFDFLSGAFVDMGFENFGDDEMTRTCTLAFGRTGVIVPGTRYRLRHGGPGQAAVEPVDGTETASLPQNWKSYVFVMDMNDQFTWVGKNVRPDQTGRNAPPTKLDGYRDMGEGWALQAQGVAPAAAR